MYTPAAAGRGRFGDRLLGDRPMLVLAGSLGPPRAAGAVILN